MEKQYLPNYKPEQVQSMRDELTYVGFTELLTPDKVDEIITQSKERSDETFFVVVNSVCGCAAGSARPGVTSALQNDIIPDNLYTVFAGMEKAAVRQLRKYLEPNLPSSPCMALFKGGELIEMIHRHDIEARSAGETTESIVKLFNDYCDAAGPSIPREKFDKLVSEQICGSTLEPYTA